MYVEDLIKYAKDIAIEKAITEAYYRGFGDATTKCYKFIEKRTPKEDREKLALTFIQEVSVDKEDIENK